MNWQSSHFYALISGFVLVALLAALSKHISRRARIWTLRGFMILLLIMEGIKQLLAVGNYSALYLPFHYSTSFYVCMGLYIFGHGKIKHYGACATYVGGFLLLMIMLASPASVIGNPTPELLRSSFYNFYSLFYHLGILFVWAVLLFNGDYKSRIGDPLRYASFLGGWAALAIPAAYHTGFNYAGILKSYIPPLEVLRLNFGNVVYLITYALITLLSTTLLIYLYHYISHTVIHRVTEENASEVSQNDRRIK